MTRHQFRIRAAKSLDALLGKLIVALGPFFKAPRSEPEGRSVKSILFIKLWGMGSIILTEPALRWLKKTYPQARLDYLTLEENRELLSFIPWVTQVHSLSWKGFFRFLVSVLFLSRNLRGRRYDLVFDAEFYASFSTLLARLTGGDWLVGFAEANTPKKILLDRCVDCREGQHSSQFFVSLVQQASMPLTLTRLPQLILPKVPSEMLLLRKRPYFVMNANAGPLALERRWPRDRFARLGQALIEHYDFDVLLVGAASEVSYVRPLARSFQRQDRMEDWTGKLTLIELAKLIRGSVCVISNDSGPMHLAAALQVPVVAFFGPETPRLYGPLTHSKLIFYRNPGCSPCMSWNNAKTVRCTNNHVCLEEMRGIEVIPQVLSFLDREVVERKSVVHGSGPEPHASRECSLA